MAKPVVSDESWAVADPLLPPEPKKPKGGGPRISSRDCLRGVISVLRASPPWPWLPPEPGCGSGTTCRRRLKEWHEAGVRRRPHRVLPERLADADRLDRSRASADSFGVPAVGGARKPARIRRVEANRARSATLWSKPGASRSRRA